MELRQNLQDKMKACQQGFRKARGAKQLGPRPGPWQAMLGAACLTSGSDHLLRKQTKVNNIIKSVMSVWARDERLNGPGKMNTQSEKFGTLQGRRKGGFMTMTQGWSHTTTSLSRWVPRAWGCCKPRGDVSTQRSNPSSQEINIFLLMVTPNPTCNKSTLWVYISRATTGLSPSWEKCYKGWSPAWPFSSRHPKIFPFQPASERPSPTDSAHW